MLVVVGDLDDEDEDELSWWWNDAGYVKGKGKTLAADEWRLEDEELWFSW